MSEATENTGAHGQEPSRRDFIYIATGGALAVGGAFTLWPFIDQMNPAADTLALASTEVNIGELEEGQEITVIYRERPHFVRRRTAAEVEAARNVDVASLPDGDARNFNLPSGSPATDDNRSGLTAALGEGVELDEALRASFLVTSANCTHLGCVPTEGAGDYGAWFCPCHGSHYDTSGRIRRGPAPENLSVPVMAFTSASVLRLG
ncbi:MAG: ubiquinol-cytochrome c reductase iron-sulfur subunit [Caulobacterales bacterium]|uniref:ubiquinol-cytochrome c reductase iron-sulfur subunit n=1 Tax=Glycocaulis sp. TaxID=1969725 RepID=UPI003F9FC9CE